MGVALQDELRVFKRASAVSGVTRNTCGFNESAYRIGKIGDDSDQAKGFDVSGELGPALEAMFAREDELRVRQREVCALNVGISQLVQAGMVTADALERIRMAQAVRFDEVFCLLLVLFEVGAGG